MAQHFLEIHIDTSEINPLLERLEPLQAFLPPVEYASVGSALKHGVQVKTGSKGRNSFKLVWQDWARAIIESVVDEYGDETR